ncbi:eCIS core domain-containing protein [Deinococcus arcticus]|uniref:eCIS core domain-containing protein n=1 Tax=Deinococcus arcticus TaxID=2136176 RepID=UPI0018EAC42F|nr:DUF4157 domain-containing protein [Deinococcus arcticus]
MFERPSRSRSPRARLQPLPHLGPQTQGSAFQDPAFEAPAAALPTPTSPACRATPAAAQRAQVAPALQAAALLAADQRAQTALAAAVQRAQAQVTQARAALAAAGAAPLSLSAWQRQTPPPAPTSPTLLPPTQRAALTVQAVGEVGAAYGQFAPYVPATERAAHALGAVQRHVQAGADQNTLLAALQRQAAQEPFGAQAYAAALQRVQAQDAALQRALQAHALQGEHATRSQNLSALDGQRRAQALQTVSARVQARRGGGEALPAAVQRHLELGLNADLSRVRVHTDSEAAGLTAGLQAKAFTSGADIYFAPGQYDPHSAGGLELLAHEVTHVVQQAQGRVAPGLDPDTGLEQEAQQTGRRLAAIGGPGGAPSTASPHPAAQVAAGTVQAGTVQRALVHEAHGSAVTDQDKAAAKTFFASYDAAVQAAHTNVLSIPSLGGLVALNGYTALWKARWDDYLQYGAADLMHAAFGYVIESYVSHDHSGFKPAAPDGYAVSTQVAAGSTRPDLVLSDKAGRQVAWLDITAANSAGHIHQKAGGWNFNHLSVAETVYPSAGAATWTTMKANKDNVGSISASQLKKQLKRAKREHERLKASWHMFGLRHLRRPLLKPRLSEVDKLRPERLRNFFTSYLKKIFQVSDLTPEMACNVLAAMNMDVKAWGFQTGFSASTQAGETWLSAHELPNLSGASDEAPDEEAEHSTKRRKTASDA